MKRYFIELIVILLLIFVFTILNVFNVFDKSDNEFACSTQKGFTGKRYSGIVERKFIDKKNHWTKTIVIRERSLKLSIYDFSHDRNNIFSLISVGDTLIKEINSKNIIIKGGQLDTVILVDYGCLEN